MEAIKIQIDEFDSARVERLFYLSNAKLSNVAFLMKDSDIDKENLMAYIKEADEVRVEMELTRNAIAKKYLPKSLVGKGFNYEFLFDTNEIAYTEE